MSQFQLLNFVLFLSLFLPKLSEGSVPHEYTAWYCSLSLLRARRIIYQYLPEFELCTALQRTFIEKPKPVLYVVHKVHAYHLKLIFFLFPTANHAGWQSFSLYGQKIPKTCCRSNESYKTPCLTWAICCENDNVSMWRDECYKNKQAWWKLCVPLSKSNLLI